MDEQTEKRDFVCTTCGEARTGGGQLVEYRCEPGDKETIKKLLSLVSHIRLPETKMMSVVHGAYGRYTRYNIIQHKYAGGGGGYIEVLEIKDPPDGKIGVVFHEHWAGESIFYEFDNLDNALAAWEKGYNNRGKQKGCIRKVVCGILSPWFYAVGDQILQGDFVFPDEIKEDAEFRFGKKYLVFDHNFPSIKICMGTGSETRELEINHRQPKTYKIVYWHDGTSWSEYSGPGKRPRILKADELWIDEAITKFHQFLAGNCADFTIEFRDGNKFEGKLKNGKSLKGIYSITFTYCKKGGEKIHKQENMDFPFTPTRELPSVESSLRNWVDEQGGEIVKIESIARKRRTKPSSFDLEWRGVFAKD